MKKCNFCNNFLKEKQFLKQGNSYICFECIENAHTLVDSRKFALSMIDELNSEIKFIEKELANRLTPNLIYQELNKKIVNQDKVKKVLSTNIYNHYNKLKLKKENPEKEYSKSNMILFGKTGSGKTLILKELSKILNKPMIIADITTFTETGFVGLDITTVFKDLYIAADKDLDKMKEGIIVFDEIDKIALRGKDKGINNPVQQELLTILEGRKVSFEIEHDNETKNHKYLEIDTSDILFIGIGAFTSIFDNKNKNSLGFMSDEVNDIEKDEENKFTQEDFIKYGFMREFAGRFSIFEKLNKLKREDYKKILLLENSILNEYKELFAIDSINLEFNDNLIDFIIEETLKSDKGARGLKFVIDNFILDIHFLYIGNKSDITLEIYYENKEIKTKEISCKKIKTQKM